VESLDTNRVRLEFANPFFINDLRLYSVRIGPALEFLDNGQLAFVPRYNEDSTFVNRYPVLVAVRSEPPISFDAVARLRRSRLEVIAGMHYTAIAPALMERRPALFFDHQCANPGFGQMICGAGSDCTCSDNDNVWGF
jgi:hypothetical protein